MLGPSGILIDYRMLVSDRQLYNNTFTVYVAVDADTPAALKAQLTDRGLSVNRTLAEEQRILDQGAYALALRLYAVAALLVLLMALAGLFVSTAVQLPARRRDAASMRVVGVPRRVVVSAVAREFAVVLGGTAIAGLAAGPWRSTSCCAPSRSASSSRFTTRPGAAVDGVQLALTAAADCCSAAGLATRARSAARALTLRERPLRATPGERCPRARPRRSVAPPSA